MINHATHDLERRCPRLGGVVKFGYCLDVGDASLPCFKVCDCWWEYFDVVDYLRNRLSQQEFETLMQSRPKPKLAGFLELIEQARKRNGIND